MTAAEASDRELILASSSLARRELLARAGLSFEVVPPSVDEGEVKRSLLAEGAGATQAAESLAELKARSVSHKRRAALVIGADQLLECEGQWFDKPADRAAALKQLESLSGKRHSLHTSICLVCDQERLWHHNVVVHLTMRPLTESFLESYLDAAGEGILATVGAYQLEGLGAQLFHKVEGDFFSVLGLPLLPLLEVLRAQGVLPR